MSAVVPVVPGIRKIGLIIFFDITCFLHHTGNWTPPLCPDNLVERIAAMSLNPNVEPVVQTTLRDGHTIAVKELRTIIREKQRMLQRGRD